MSTKDKPAAMGDGLGYQLTMCAEMYGVPPQSAVGWMVRSGVPIHMFGLLEDPIWRAALFEAEAWVNEARHAPNPIRTFKHAARMVAAEAAALVAAHDAYFAALENVGKVYAADGAEGLARAAASCAALADNPGRYPL